MSKAKINKKLVGKLRDISKVIEQHNISVSFPTPEGDLAGDCPFVDKACESIEHGGMLDARSLESLIYYLADMMEE